jgi:hypothetical protein
MPIHRVATLARVLVAGAATASALLVGATPGFAAPGAPTQHVGFQGTYVTVPEAWPVISLAADPTACVRLDRHAVYLGSPGDNQDCPANVMGHSEAVIVEPAAGAAPEPVSEDSVSREFDRVAGGVRIIASYGADRTTAQAIMDSATPQPGASVRPDAVVPMTATLPANASNLTGKGFDPCTAPSASTMNAWLASPYRAIGVYIGGENRGCSQPNLTPSWVATQVGAGWHFFPLYVGKQASTSSCSSCSKISSAGSDGRTEADDAVNKAAALGFGPGTPINFDMESYSSSSTTTVLTFLSAWSDELHARGYASGVYSSSSSGIKDLVSHYTSYTMPDVIDDALWNGAANTSDANVPSTEWANHQRIHQYSGGHTETYGGVGINIDQDYLDVQCGTRAAPALAYDNGNSTMNIYRWTSTGSSFNSPTVYTSGTYHLSSVGRLTATGDVNGDGTTDIVQAYQNSDGTFSYHVFLNGNASAGIWYTSGPFNLGNVGGRLVVADFNGDGRAEPALVYDAGSTQTIYRWLSNGTSFTRTTDYIGTGSFDLTNVQDRVAAGDVNGDGNADVVEAYQKSDGTFSYYVFLDGLDSTGIWYTSGPYNLGNVGNRLVVADFNGDGRAEPALVYDAGSTQTIYRWLSNGTSFTRTADYVGTGSFDLANVDDLVAAGDVNGDGSADIVEAYQKSDGTFSYYVFLDGLDSTGIWYTSGPYALANTADRLVLGSW